jgi:protein O-GlcNAc transferase
MTTDNLARPGDAPTVDDVVGAMHAGRAEEARRAARALLATDPGSWAAWHLVSLISTTGGGSPPLAAFRRAVGIAPEKGELWGALAAALEHHGAVAPALGAARRAVILVPAASEALINFGTTLKEAGHRLPAATWLNRARALAPGNPVILNNRGLIHLDSDEPQPAAEILRQAVTVAPFYVDARLNLAIVERRLERPSAAMVAILPALSLTPSDSAFLGELGTILVTIGEAETGLAWLTRALAVDPSNQAAMASCLGALSYVPNLTEARRRTMYAAASIQARRGAGLLAAPPALAAKPDNRITIGYVSASWRSHPMAEQLIGLLANHRRDRVRTIAYADLKHRDGTTERLRTLVEDWRETTGLSDGHVAEMVRADAIDALVFLALHEDGSRRSLPCLRAAPSQLSLHDISTSGLEEIDVWITDRTLHPSGNTEWFSEWLVHVPSLFLFPPLDDRPSPSPSTTLPIRFASFNNPAKLSRPTLAAWAEILRRVPGASILLKYRTLYQDPAVATHVRQAFGSLGIDGGRITFGTGALSRGEHLDMIAATDIVLDPFPYNGNTATMEALWMGVPVVSLAGSRFVGRMGTDILAKIGHNDLVARSVHEYVAIAVALAGDGPRRSGLRQRLRSDVKRSALFDAPEFARSLEDAIIALVQDRRGGG